MDQDMRTGQLKEWFSCFFDFRKKYITPQLKIKQSGKRKLVGKIVHVIAYEYIIPYIDRNKVYGRK